ncbi:MAG: AAA family ATPase [Allosphingosinicella sp.]
MTDTIMQAKPIRQKAKSSLGAFVSEDAIAAVTKAAEEIGATAPQVIVGRVADAIRRLADVSTPRQLVVDISGSTDPLAAIDSLAEVCDEGTQVIALGDVNDVELYRSLVRHGVQDYLVKPVSAETVVAALSRAEHGPNGEAAPKIGRLIAVIGARGGVGATTVATNLAWTLANDHGMRVALVDLDLFFGTCGLSLDLELGRGFREALENPARVDSLFIERAMVREGENLFVLSTEEALDGAFSFDPSALTSLIEHLRRDFQCVVFDFPRFAARRQAQVLTPPSAIMIVSDPSLAGMRDTMRLSALLKKTAANAEITVVLNRVGATRTGELSRSDFEKGAEVKVDQLIPIDTKAMAASASAGKPVVKVAGQAKATAALRTLARRFATGRVRRSKLHGWRSWLKGGR